MKPVLLPLVGAGVAVKPNDGVLTPSPGSDELGPEVHDATVENTALEKKKGHGGGQPIGPFEYSADVGIQI